MYPQLNIIDDFLGGSHSEAMDVLVEQYVNDGGAAGAAESGSAASDLAADLQAFADSRRCRRSH